jgi:hypothetical protein
MAAMLSKTFDAEQESIVGQPLATEVVTYRRSSARTVENGLPRGKFHWRAKAAMLCFQRAYPG